MIDSPRSFSRRVMDINFKMASIYINFEFFSKKMSKKAEVRKNNYIMKEMSVNHR